MRKLLLLPLLFLAFGANAQGDCDSLDLYSITYHPFDGSQVMINVTNASTSIFSYPGFVVLNQANDTIAVETVNFFGIADTSNHLLDLHPGMPTGNDFSARIELHTNFMANLECTWIDAVSLCPSGACHEVLPQIANVGGGMTDQAFEWLIADTSQSQVAGGVFNLDSVTQFQQAVACLVPGQYNLRVESSSQPMGQVWVSLASSLGGPVAGQVQFQVGNTSLPFTLFEQCPLDSSGMSIGELPSSNLTWFTRNNQLIVTDTDSKPLQQVALYDMHGRLVAQQRIGASSASLDVSNRAAGLYIVRVGTGAETRSLKVALR